MAFDKVGNGFKGKMCWINNIKFFEVIFRNQSSASLLVSRLFYRSRDKYLLMQHLFISKQI